ncbi:MAG: signal peptidase II [Thermomicrobiales bacterium]
MTEPTAPQRSAPRWSAISVIAGGVLLADQVVKWIVSAWIGVDATRHRVDLVGSIVAFEYIQNTGAAFGILAGQPMLLAVFAVLATALFIGMMRTTLRTHPLVPIAVGLVLGGAIGNLLDRIRLGYVVDFVAVGSYPRFNIADSAITIGLILMAWTALRDEKPAPADGRAPDDPETPGDTTPSTPTMRNGSHA